MKALRAILILFAAGAAPHCSTRTVIERPKLAISVVGPDGKPVPNAQIILAHLSYPHTRLESSEPFTTDDKGRIDTVEKLGSETVAWLCMHGVPQHFYAVCASGPGGSAYKQWNPKDNQTLELRLDPTLGPCNEEAMRYGPRAPRSDAPVDAGGVGDGPRTGLPTDSAGIIVGIIVRRASLRSAGT
jgi:hypothetical protein